MSAERPFLKKTFAQLVDETLATLADGAGGRVVLDDATEGSVLRTLVEAFSRELAVCYEQLEGVYAAGYLDTADGPALEKVVELLGIRRHQAGWLEGDALFSRATPAPADLEIPAGTLLAGKQVQGFTTLLAATLAAGEREVRVPIRSLEPKGDPVQPGRLDTMHRPIPGIESVTNPGKLLPRRQPEDDAALRRRARLSVRGGATATASALQRAVLSMGLVEVEISENPERRPGWVEVLLADEELGETEYQAVARRLDEVRPVGIRVQVVRAQAIHIRLRVVLLLEQDLSPQDRNALLARIDAQLEDHFKALKAGQTVRWNRIRNLLLSNPELAEVQLPEDAWVLQAVDADTGKPPESDADADADAPQRQLGSPAAPIGVFIGSGERARLHRRRDIELQAPELPVWVDVRARLRPGEDGTASEAAIRRILAELLPDEPLASPMTYSLDQLATRLAAELPGIDTASWRFIVLHVADGRVLTLADAADAADAARFEVRERIEVRHVVLLPAAEDLP